MGNNLTSQKNDKTFWPVASPFFIGVFLFFYGFLLKYFKHPKIQLWQTAILIVTPIALCAIIVLFKRSINSLARSTAPYFQKHSEIIDSLPAKRIGLWILVSAAMGLYAELMIIRLHGSYFQLFAYFKNVSLLSCFLGFGMGFSRGSKNPLLTPLIMPLIVAQIALMYAVRILNATQILQNPISEQLSLGLKQASTVGNSMVVYGFLILIFAFNALCFVPIGQLQSRLMTRSDKLVSYSWNLTGSLAGILLFSIISFLWAPPAVWTLLLTLMLMWFLRGNVGLLMPTALGGLLLTTFLGLAPQSNKVDIYSPYQILSLTFQKDRPPEVKVNNVYFQRILDLRENRRKDDAYLSTTYEHYALPYRFKPNPGDVLVVGSGTGNDVAAAVLSGAGHIDAVEIDPAILKMGRMFHPASPYLQPNVQAHVNDARAFLRSTAKKFDLIVYGLLDSHTLLSGMSGVRLDSYIYTVEAFREARKRLKAGGIMCLTFCVIKPELAHKLYIMLREAFDGKAPAVYVTGYDVGFAFIIGDEFSKPALPASIGIADVSDMAADNALRADKSTDDWPFFYMPIKKYPLSYVVMLGILLLVSVTLMRGLMTDRRTSFSWPCFFLGAAFMLIETKAITELALTYGSTWIVISAVIAGIMIMAFLSNLFIIKKAALNVGVSYALLILALFIGMYLSSKNIFIGSAESSKIIMPLLLTLPMFFSGMVFSLELDRSSTLPGAFSANLLGSMVGGFLEYNSMYFGFKFLYILAIVMYASAFFSSRLIAARK